MSVDHDFLTGGRMGSLSQDLIGASLEALGVHIVDYAEQIAAAQGVKPKKIVRRGKVLDNLKLVMSEEKADLLVLCHEERTFFDKRLFKGDVEDHVQEPKTRTGVEVKIIQ